MLATELPSFYLSMGGKGGKKFGPRRKGCPKFKPGPNKMGVPRRWPRRKVAAQKVAAKKVANQNDDDQADTGEPNAPAAENPTDNANIVFDEDDSDDRSFVQVGPQRVAQKGDGPDVPGKPDPNSQNDADQVEAVERLEPKRSCRSQNGCGKIFCLLCYPE